MSLFNFKKKKEEAKESACNCGCSSGEIKQSVNGAQIGEICCVKVLGAGCKACHEMYENTKKAVSEAGLSAEVEYITDMPRVMEYGVMSMPALVVNEKVVSQGKVMKPSEIAALLKKLELNGKL